MKPEINQAISVAARYNSGISEVQICGPSRDRCTTDARRMTCGLLAGLVKDREVAEAINRDRTTVLHFRRTSADMERFDPRYRRQFTTAKADFDKWRKCREGQL